MAQWQLTVHGSDWLHGGKVSSEAAQTSGEAARRIEGRTCSGAVLTFGAIRLPLPSEKQAQRRLSGCWPIFTGAVFGVLLACSAWSSWEVNGQGRAAGLGAARAANAKLNRLKADQGRLEVELARLGARLPAKALRARQKALEYDRRWTSTRG